MAVIDYIDGPNRRIYLDASTVDSEVHPIDIYKEMRALRRADENLRKYDLFMEAVGNEPKGAGKFTERFVKLLDGTTIIPFDSSGSLTITGTIINDAGQEGIPLFDKDVLSVGVEVDINYVPPQVEVIEVNVGGGADEAKLEELKQFLAGEIAIWSGVDGWR